MAVTGGCGSGSSSNTPTTGTAAPAAPAASAPADRKYLLERVDERPSCSSTPTASTTLPLEREDSDLAPLSGRARRPRHLSTTSATRTTSRCATCSKRSSPTPTGVDAGDAGRDRALHEAVLDQHRSLQQPDGAQVRAEVHARRVRGRRGGGASQRRAVPAAAGETLDVDADPLQPLFFDPAVDPIVTSKTPGKGKDILAASANNLYVGVTMADLEGFDEKLPAQLAAGEEGRQAGRRGLPRRRPLRRADREHRLAPRGGAAVRHRADGQGAVER